VFTASKDAAVDAAPLKRRVIHGCLVGLIVSTTLVPSHDPAHAAVVDDIRSDANWILSAQLSDGAIANYVDRQAVWPYLANFAAMGLARATQVTKDKRYIDAAWRWTSWYQGHMDAQGFVTDYVVKSGKLLTTGFMDSTDAYAGTFLLAVRYAYRVDPSLTRLKGLKKGIDAAVRAIEATQTKDGLTWAKPAWKVKYLMDQAEAYAGLLAAAELARILKDSALANRASGDAKRMLVGVGGLWNQNTLSYDWAVHEDGSRLATEWSFLYSDALQQPWAVAFGLVDPVRSRNLMSRFATSQPKWASPGEIALFTGGSQERVGYWPIAGLGLYRLGSSSAASAVSSIRSAALSAGRAWPFTTGNAGQLILFEAYSLPGAVTFDGEAGAVTLAGSTIPSATMSLPVASSGPTPSSQTPAAATPSPTPAPTPLVDVTAQVGPVSGEAAVGGGGVDAYATASPVAGSPAP
jgi:hypothetical protein